MQILSLIFVIFVIYHEKKILQECFKNRKNTFYQSGSLTSFFSYVILELIKHSEKKNFIFKECDLYKMQT